MDAVKHQPKETWYMYVVETEKALQCKKYKCLLCDRFLFSKQLVLSHLHIAHHRSKYLCICYECIFCSCRCLEKGKETSSKCSQSTNTKTHIRRPEVKSLLNKDRMIVHWEWRATTHRCK